MALNEDSGAPASQNRVFSRSSTNNPVNQIVHEGRGKRTIHAPRTPTHGERTGRAPRQIAPEPKASNEVLVLSPRELRLMMPMVELTIFRLVFLLD